LNTLRYK